MNSTSNQPSVLILANFPKEARLLRLALEEAHVDNLIRELWDGDQAIAYFKGEGKFENRQIFPMPRLILLDLNLPKRSGLEVLQWLHEQQKFQGMRIVALFDSENLPESDAARGMGVSHFLIKPLDLKQIVRLLVGLSVELAPGNDSWIQATNSYSPARGEPLLSQEQLNSKLAPAIQLAPTY